MPDFLRGVMGAIVNALASIGVVAVLAFVYRHLRGAVKRPETPPGRVLHGQLADAINKEANESQTAIAVAVESDDPAEELARLANERAERS